VSRGLLERLRALFPRRYRGLRGVGQRWERLAEARLKAAGYAIRERNFRGRFGEIDLVAEEAGVLCFVEVKGRSGPGFGEPAEAVTLEKQRRIAAAAREYLRGRRLPESTICRFDVVGVVRTGGRAEVSILRGAFELPDRPSPRRVLN
jgi:putative endonuclease